MEAWSEKPGEAEFTGEQIQRKLTAAAEQEGLRIRCRVLCKHGFTDDVARFLVRGLSTHETADGRVHPSKLSAWAAAARRSG